MTLVSATRHRGLEPCKSQESVKSVGLYIPTYILKTIYIYIYFFIPNLIAKLQYASNCLMILYCSTQTNTSSWPIRLKYQKVNFYFFFYLISFIITISFIALIDDCLTTSTSTAESHRNAVQCHWKGHKAGIPFFTWKQGF